MLKQEFEELRTFIQNATASERWPLLFACFEMQKKLCEHINPNADTEAVMLGMLAKSVEFFHLLGNSKNLPRFTVARERYWLRCSIHALEDELKLQLSGRDLILPPK